MSKRNYSIELYRIIATIVICIHHMQTKCGLHIFTNSDLFVEFFLILSGLFLAQSFIKETEHSASRYFIKRVKYLYPEYIVAAVIAIAGYTAIGKFDINMALPELFMVQNIGFFTGGCNYPCWYISTMLVCGFLIYSLLKYNSKLFVRIIIPLTVICGFTYISAHGEEEFLWSIQGCVYIPMLRTFCSMSLGVFLRYMSECEFVGQIKKSIATVAEVACIAVITVGVTANILSDYITVMAMALLIFLTYNRLGWLGGKIFDRRIFGKIGSYSYPIYLCHGFISNMLDVINRTYMHLGGTLMPIYIAATLIFAVVFHNVIKTVNKKIIARKTGA